MLVADVVSLVPDWYEKAEDVAKSTETKVEESPFEPFQNAEKKILFEAVRLSKTYLTNPVFTLHKHNPSYEITKGALLSSKIKNDILIKKFI